METWQSSKRTQRASLKLGPLQTAHLSLARHQDLSLSHPLDLIQRVNLAPSPNVSCAKTQRWKKTLLFKLMPRSRPRTTEKLRQGG